MPSVTAPSPAPPSWPSPSLLSLQRRRVQGKRWEEQGWRDVRKQACSWPEAKAIRASLKGPERVQPHSDQTTHAQQEIVRKAASTSQASARHPSRPTSALTLVRRQQCRVVYRKDSLSRSRADNEGQAGPRRVGEPQTPRFLGGSGPAWEAAPQGPAPLAGEPPGVCRAPGRPAGGGAQLQHHQPGREGQIQSREDKAKLSKCISSSASLSRVRAPAPLCNVLEEHRTQRRGLQCGLWGRPRLA